MSDITHNSPPKNWVSASHPEKAGIKSSHARFKRNLIQLRDNLVNDIMAAGIAEKDAISIVNHNLIGIKKPARGPAGYYASQDAIAILRQNEDETSLRYSPNWVSKTKLCETYYVGDGSVHKLNALIDNFRNNVCRDIIAAGIVENDANAIIKQNFVGFRRPNKGPPSTYISPDAVGMLEREGKIRKRDDTEVKSR